MECHIIRFFFPHFWLFNQIRITCVAYFGNLFISIDNLLPSSTCSNSILFRGRFVAPRPSSERACYYRSSPWEVCVDKLMAEGPCLQLVVLSAEDIELICRRYTSQVRSQLFIWLHHCDWQYIIIISHRNMWFVKICGPNIQHELPKISATDLVKSWFSNKKPPGFSFFTSKS